MTIAMAFRAVTEMSDDELIAELRTLIGIGVAVLERAAAVYRELQVRGVRIEVPSLLFRDLLPRLAAGDLTAEAVAAFLDLPRHFRAIGRLPADQQRRLAAGVAVEVVSDVGMPATAVPARQIPDDLVPTVFVGSRLATPAEQDRILSSRKTRKARPVRKDEAKAHGGGPATAAECDTLVAHLKRELAARGVGRPTVNQLVEMAIAAGWGQTG